MLGNDETETPETVELPGLVKPSPQVSEGSRSTEESVTAFIERTIEVMSQTEAEIIDPLQSRQGVTARMVTVSIPFLKASVSEPITVRNDLTNIETGAGSSKETESTEEVQGL